MSARMGDWTPQIVNFMMDATIRTSYFKDLAETIEQEVQPGCYLCDAGCGMGQLSFELASYARCIDAVDYSLNAIALAGHSALFGGYGNVLVRYGDFGQQLFPVPYDCMIFSLSASFDDAYEIARRSNSRKMIVINKIHKRIEADRSCSDAQPYSRVGRPMVYDYDETVKNLRERGFAVKARQLSLDFGQPLRSLQAARDFVMLYRSLRYPNGITDAELKSLLVPGSTEDFPYYLPMTRHLAMFTLDMQG